MRGELLGNRPSEHQFPAPGLLQSKNLYPWLVYLHGDRHQNQTFGDISSSSGESITLPGLRQGLQRNTIHEGLVSSSSSTLPDSNSNLVLLFFTEIPLILYCHVGGDIKYWSEFNYAQSIEAQSGTPVRPGYFLCSPVSFNGTIYATASCEMDLVRISIDHGKKNGCEIHLAGTIPLRGRSNSNHRSFLLSMDGSALCLILIFPESSFSKYPRPDKIRIYKFNFSQNAWKSMKSFDGGAAFLCGSHSFYCSRQGASLWSYIYFTLESDQTLFSYRVEDDKVTLYLQEPWLSYWIMPALSLQPCGSQLHDSVPVSSCNIVDLPKDPMENKPADFSNKHRRRKISKREMTSLCDLSDKVLDLIAGRLSLVDYMDFRCVNKLCAASTIRTRINPFPPSLIYKDNLNCVYHIIDSNLNRKLSIKIPEVIRKYEISCSRFGWLLLKRYGHRAFFNPLTMQVVIREGAQPRTKHGIINSTFLGKPSSSQCAILEMSAFGTWADSYFIKRPRSSPAQAEWQVFVVGKQDPRRVFRQGGNTPVFVGEFCYYLGDDGLLGRGRLTESGNPPFRWEVFADLASPVVGFRRNYLTECGGEILSIFIGGGGNVEGNKSWVRVFKLQDEKKKWVEMNSLEGYCLFLSSPSSLSYLAERPDMANRIYFPMFYSKELVYYSLNTKRYHCVGSQDELQSFNEVHYNGFLSKSPGRLYRGGYVTAMRKCNADYWSKIEVNAFLHEDMKIPGDGKDMDEGLALLSSNDSANTMATIGLEHGLVDPFVVHQNKDGELSDDEDDPVDSPLTQEVLTPRMILESIDCDEGPDVHILRRTDKENTGVGAGCDKEGDDEEIGSDRESKCAGDENIVEVNIVYEQTYNSEGDATAAEQAEAVSDKECNSYQLEAAAEVNTCSIKQSNTSGSEEAVQTPTGSDKDGSEEAVQTATGSDKECNNDQLEAAAEVNTCSKTQRNTSGSEEAVQTATGSVKDCNSEGGKGKGKKKKKKKKKKVVRTYTEYNSDDDTLAKMPEKIKAKEVEPNGNAEFHDSDYDLDTKEEEIIVKERAKVWDEILKEPEFKLQPEFVAYDEELESSGESEELLSGQETEYESDGHEDQCLEARATYPARYKTIIEQLRVLEPQAIDWLRSNTNPKNWTMSHFKYHANCDVLVNNIFECINKVLLHAREKALLTLLTCIFLYLMERHRQKREAAAKMVDVVGPKIRKMLENLKERTCECWAVDAGEWNYQAAYETAYKYVIYPTNGEEMWKKTKKPNIMPPDKILRAGRPPKSRKKTKEELREMRVKKKGDVEVLSHTGTMTYKCSECGLEGHNKRQFTGRAVPSEQSKKRKKKPNTKGQPKKKAKRTVQCQLCKQTRHYRTTCTSTVADMYREEPNENMPPTEDAVGNQDSEDATIPPKEDWGTVVLGFCSSY
ncbi:OLC1v1024199C1 [Oldenlandia corymbosa var. corymbosa]|uniref:OLC1v1024199C1 n=1 Tax=Oldenlandia corymbosa var. corymbosa TaxID=529605 RepID=A0AAV1C366_OLDCO|nr:OLC1v1024199C1 [Oldenlandia corymbosa var. corymbosa]